MMTLLAEQPLWDNDEDEEEDEEEDDDDDEEDDDEDDDEEDDDDARIKIEHIYFEYFLTIQSSVRDSLHLVLCCICLCFQVVKHCYSSRIDGCRLCSSSLRKHERVGRLGSDMCPSEVVTHERIELRKKVKELS